jgi:hypothetical protein
MEDNPDWWSSPTSEEEWKQRLAEAEERHQRKRAEWEAQKVRHAEAVEQGFSKRNWAVWRRYKAGGVTLKQVGDEFGISGDRARQISVKCDRQVRKALNHNWNNVPDEVRNAALGVEFVFRNELTFGREEPTRKWDQQLELNEHGSAYSHAVPDWCTSWGEQDTKPAKARKVYTYYKVVIEEGANHGG